MRAARALVLGVAGLAMLVRHPDPGSLGPAVLAASLLVGLPHGALDHQLAQRWPGPAAASFHIAYVLGVAAVLCGWLFAPWAGVLLLLLSAAWHFGESDLLHLPPSQRSGWLVASRGALLIGGPLLVEPEVAAGLLSSVAGLDEVVPPGPSWMAWALLGGHALHAWLQTRSASLVLDALGVGLLVLGGGPVIGLAAYFVLWHTPDHFASVQRSSGMQPLELARAALPRTLLAAVGIVALVAALGPPDVLRIVVWAVAALTVPHAFVVHFALSARTESIAAS